MGCSDWADADTYIFVYTQIHIYLNMYAYICIYSCVYVCIYEQGTIEAVGGGWTAETGVKIAIDDVAVGDKIMFRFVMFIRQSRI